MKALEYKGIRVFPVYNSEDCKFQAVIRLTSGATGFVNGASVDELTRQFRETVDAFEAIGQPLEQRTGIAERIAQRVLTPA